MKKLKLTKVINMYPSGKGEFGFTLEFNHNMKIQYVVKKDKYEDVYVIENADERNEKFGMLVYKSGVGFVHSYEVKFINWSNDPNLVEIEFDIPYGEKNLMTFNTLCYRDITNKTTSILPYEEIPEKLRDELDKISVENQLI